jgi:hypothetical protein
MERSLVLTVLSMTMASRGDLFHDYGFELLLYLVEWAIAAHGMYESHWV